jgi:hypothetical protein
MDTHHTHSDGSMLKERLSGLNSTSRQTRELKIYLLMKLIN